MVEKIRRTSKKLLAEEMQEKLDQRKRDEGKRQVRFIEAGNRRARTDVVIQFHKTMYALRKALSKLPPGQQTSLKAELAQLVQKYASPKK